MKVFTYIIEIFLIIITSVLILYSLVAIISIHIKLFDQGISYTPKGISIYFSAFTEYSGLFAGTITVIVAFIGLQRYKEASKSNKELVKNKVIEDKKEVLDSRFHLIEKNDPMIKREFIRFRRRYLNHLYELNFKIENKQELVNAFEIFSDYIIDYEKTNKEFLSWDGNYHKRMKYKAFSFDSFRYLFTSVLDKYYKNLEDDLENLYREALPENLEDLS